MSELINKIVQGVKGNILVLFKFCIVGLITAGIQLASFKALLLMELNYQISSFIGLLVSTTLAYFGNRMWSFRSRNPVVREFFKFYLSRVVTVPLNSLILLLLVQELHVGKVLAQVLSIGTILLINFLVGKSLVFTTSELKTEG